MTAPAIPAANDAAAAYQRLRSHLAYLKLPAAAEALPGILDAARDQHLTVLDALEQLLGIEAAAEQRKLASRLRWAALPAPRIAGRLRFLRPARRRRKAHPRAGHAAVPRRYW